MKRIPCILLMIPILLLASCSTKDTESENTGGTKTTTYQIYVEYAMDSDGDTMISANADIPIVCLEDKDFILAGTTVVENKNAPQTRSITIGEDQYQLTLLKSTQNALGESAKEELRALGMMDEYTGYLDEQRVSLSFRQDSGELLYLAIPCACDVEGPLTLEQARTKADAQFMELFGSDIMSKYVHRTTVQMDDSMGKYIYVSYMNDVCGYPSGDIVIFRYNMQGKLVGINAKKMSYFDMVEQRITAEQIENARDVLLNAIPDTWTVDGSGALVIDADGICYLSVYATSEIEMAGGLDPAIQTAIFYINIE